MKGILYILLTLCLGIFLTIYNFLPSFVLTDWSKYVLYLLVFLVGINIGMDTSYLNFIRRIGYKIIFVPLGILVGSTLGGMITSFFIDLNIADSAAVTSACGYYSLSSIILSEAKGEVLGLIALISNLFRELFTLSMAPLLSKYFGKLAIISGGGVSSGDVTLVPVIKYDGKEYGIIAIFNGFVLGIIVSLFINIFIIV